MRYKFHLIPLSMLLLAAFVQNGFAGNVDLSTVPRRDTVALTIYNSEDLTLVRETRAVTFKKGANPLQFSWANTLIDPTSVQLRFLANAEKLDVLDTTFPHDKPQMLVWNVKSDFDGEATVEITYFTSGITWQADYLAIADKAEKTVGIEGFVRVTNNSGEAYEDAQVRLVVGKINLVEKIAQLARVPVELVDKLDESKKSEFRTAGARQMMGRGMKGDGLGGGMQAKEIIKEGLSEYFIFTIEGTETIPNGWSKRMRSMNADAVPVKIQYRYRPREYGEQLSRLYLLTNDKASKLGDAPLPDGVLRVFRDNGRGGLSFLAAQQLKYIPIGDKIELNLGVDPNVAFELVKLRASRDNIWMRENGVEVFHAVGQPGIAIDANSTVVGWDDHEIYAQRIRNYTASPIEVEIRRSLGGDVIFRSGLKPTQFDYQTAQFTATVDAGKKADLLFEVVRHQGHNAKQNHVTLEDAGVENR